MHSWPRIRSWPRSSDEPEDRRWFVRVTGDEKDVYSIWFQLGQRTLSYETYVMPAPEENEAAFFEHLLRRNTGFYGLAFEIGEEEAVFLAGQLGNDAIDEDELDRVLGTIYAAVEDNFRALLELVVRHPLLELTLPVRLARSRPPVSVSSSVLGKFQAPAARHSARHVR